MYRWPILFFCTGISTWQYLTIALKSCVDCTGAIASFAAGDGVSPFVYRVLTLKVLVWLGNTPQVLTAFHFVMLFLFFSLLWSWTEQCRGNGATAVALATVALSSMWTTYYYSAYTVTEWVLWLSGLLILVSELGVRRIQVVFGILVVVATANREVTAVLLLLSWFALYPRAWRTGLIYTAIAVGTYIAIRIAVGPREHPFGLPAVLQHNLYPWSLQNSLLYMGLLLPLFIGFVINRRAATLRLRRLSVIVLVVYLPLWAGLAIWDETRLLMPVIVLGLPVITRAGYNTSRESALVNNLQEDHHRGLAETR
jgi:hypothetical protein